MSRDPRLDLLADVHLYSQLGHSELARVVGPADVLDVPDGRVLMRRGKTGAEAIVLVSGGCRR